MIHITENASCCGCEACSNICPKYCISLIEDSEGFRYPYVDRDNCIDCGLCEKTCPMFNNSEVEYSGSIESYIAYNKDDNIRAASSSGGIFYSLAKLIIGMNGVVYGAVMSQDFHSVNHIRGTTIEQIMDMRGSKYIQSMINDVYKQAKEDLEENKQVLFCGTPCQIEGLLNVIGRNYENLACMDFICHGVPSQKTWRQYIDYYEKQTHQRIKGVDFRDKSNGWQRYRLSLTFENTSLSFDHADDIFLKLFINNINMRPSCYICPFRKVHRASDITVADCWGVSGYSSNMNDDKGVSLIVLHSDKGKKLFNIISHELVFKSIDSDIAFINNPSVNKQVIKTSYRKKYFDSIDDISIVDACQKYTKPPLWKQVGRIIKKCVAKLRRKAIMIKKRVV